MAPIDIQLTFSNHAGEEQSRALSADDFFDLDDPDLDDSNETSLFDLTWRQGCPPSELAQAPLADLARVRLVATCSSTRERLEIVERLWASGRCRSLDRKDSQDGVDIGWSRIIEIDTPEGIHFLRFDSESSEPTGLRSHDVVLPGDRVRNVFP